MVRVQGEDQRDEIKAYQDRRSIGASEAVWRLFANRISERSPAVYAMRVHLPDQQMVYFQPGDEENAVQRESSRKTELTEFFTFNSMNPNTKVSYIRFPGSFVWDKKARKWKPREKDFGTIGRILTVHPIAGEVFYLRMLLSHDHSAGAKSFEDLRTVDGHIHLTFQDSCCELGLLLHDREWETVLQDAGHTQMCPQIRELFVTLLMFCNVTNPRHLFETYHEQWWDDYSHRAQRHTESQVGIDPALLRTLVLCDIERRLLVNDF